MAEKPTAAFVLGLIGGIFILLWALFVTVIGAILSPFGGGALAGLGLIGLVASLLIIVGSVMLYAQPENHTAWGAITLVFALVSLVPPVFGAFIGWILALVGGILGLVWKPEKAVMMPPPPPPPSG